MIVVIQRVSSASVTIGGELHSAIGPGLLLLCGIAVEDTPEDVQWCVRKVTEMRLFADSSGVMNISVREKGFEVLAVSQFTLHADVKKGNRPSYIRAARPEVAIPLYELFLAGLEGALPGKVRSGVFGADMQVGLVNDGPVTILLDTSSR